MTKAYKLTDKAGRTYGGMQWDADVEYTAPGGAPCTADVIHWYRTPLMAVLFDPIHGRFGPDARLWICDVTQTGSDGTKAWGTRCRTIKEITKPVITTEHRVEIAIRCAMKVFHDMEWAAWAQRWLSGKDRSEASVMPTKEDGRASAAHWAASEASWAAAGHAKEAVPGGSERGHALRRQAVATASAEAVAWAVAAKADVLDVINSVMEGN
jgi:hypothetical protein